MERDGKGRFVEGDLVTADGKGVGRVYKSEYTTPKSLDQAISKVRLAGDVTKMQWFYKVRGGGFNENQWLRERTLKFADE